ncbi:acyltransferase family protein [Neobacillus kokaensis]|uniref:Acyltransferase n=1 Tax=Neobacillus kokaensis TaxID=2759023 RepID=A0ABQ3NBV1_9BACI|nr:acyltransferase [Neobacillus kokaensis]GHI01362.1 acyltransferase [Neobacillus kokaensis]
MSDKPFVFSKNMTSIAKGLAILLMVYHHSFAFPERIENVDYLPLLFIDHQPLSELIGQFGKLCVAIFLFLSGFGLYKSYESKGNFTFRNATKRAFNFIKFFWVIFLLFVPIGLIFFNEDPRYVWNLKEFLYNFFALVYTYNGEWWFVSLYVELLLIFPLLMKLIKKNPILVSYLTFVVFFLSAFFQHTADYFPNHELIQIFFHHLGVDTTWLIVFITGIYFAKYEVFKILDEFFSNIYLNHKFFFINLLVLCVYFREKVFPFIIETRGPLLDGDYNYADFFLAPIVVIAFIKIIQNVTVLENLFMRLGKHSNNIWLTHTFFIYYYFQEVTFVPYLSVLIVTWVFVLTILVSICINFIIKYLFK